MVRRLFYLGCSILIEEHFEMLCFCLKQIIYCKRLSNAVRIFSLVPNIYVDIIKLSQKESH